MDTLGDSKTLRDKGCNHFTKTTRKSKATADIYICMCMLIITQIYMRRTGRISGCGSVG
jgi:hypothetical protein